MTRRRPSRERSPFGHGFTIGLGIGLAMGLMQLLTAAAAVALYTSYIRWVAIGGE